LNLITYYKHFEIVFNLNNMYSNINKVFDY